MDMKKTVKLEYAYVKAQALFETFDKKKIENDIQLMPDDKETILKDYRRSAVARFQDNVFVDQNKIDLKKTILLMEYWQDVVSYGEENPHFNKIPKEFIRNPFNYTFENLCDAARQKVIIEYCTDQLKPKQDSTRPEGLQCLYTPDELKTIYSKLKAAEKLIDKSVTELDFVNAFQADTLPVGWKRINWTGSKKMLSTLVWKLTGEKPRPIEINRIFIVKSAFDSRDCVTVDEIENRHHHLDIKKLFPDPE